VTNGDRSDALFLYAAGALEGPEREDIEEWIAPAVPGVKERLARAELEVARLAASQPPVAPSPVVRERLLARIARREAPQTGASTRRRRRSRNALARLAIAAGLTGVLAAGVAGALTLRARAERETMLREQLAAAQREVGQANADLEALRAAAAEAEAEIADLEARHRSLESDLVLAGKAIMVLRSEQMQSLALDGTRALPSAHGRVFWDWKNWYCYLHAQGFAADPKSTYAVWLFTEDGAVIGVGTFHPDAHGEATFLAPVPHDVGHVLRAGISREPDGDIGTKPRGEVVMLGEAS
jgi:anti-sigma-K factor RskA